MALIDKKLYTMSMPKAMNRGYAIPLDASSVWYSYDAMATYAEKSGVAYVGQILSLVDESDNNKVTAYIITNEAGALQKVGTATLGDNETIVLDENTNTLGLNNWGKKYHKWIAATEEVAGHYEEVEVDDVNYFWINGLEPKALKTENGFELAWYEPNPSTLEGVEDAIAALQASINEITIEIGTKEDTEETDSLYSALNKVEAKAEENSNAIKALQEEATKHLSLTGGTMTGDIILSDGGKVLSNKEIEVKIASAVESAGHLKRAFIDRLPTIEEADIETIYMVKDPLATGNDVYQEFMIIEGEWAQIGDTSVDLTNYMQKVAEATEGNLAAFGENGILVDADVKVSDINNHLTNTEIHITTEERTAWNEAKATAEEVAQSIAALVKISQNDADKLAALPAITTIGSGLAIDEAGAVSLEIDSSSANGLAVDENGLKMNLATSTTAGALSAEMYNKINNLSEGIPTDGVTGALLGNSILAEITADRQLILPFANETTPGLVVSSTKDNSVSVDEATGIMTINRVATTNLYVPQGEELVLVGGSSSLN